MCRSADAPLRAGHVKAQRTARQLVPRRADPTCLQQSHRLAKLMDEGFAVVVRRGSNSLEPPSFKRRPAPPGVQITRKAFGRDRRHPITNGSARSGSAAPAAADRRPAILPWREEVRTRSGPHRPEFPRNESRVEAPEPAPTGGRPILSSRRTGAGSAARATRPDASSGAELPRTAIAQASDTSYRLLSVAYHLAHDLARPGR